MNDLSIFRAILISQLLDMLKPIVATLAALLLFYGVVHVLVKRLERKSEPLVPIVCEYPDESEFRDWYNALLTQNDFSEDEARALYALVDHPALHSEVETTPVEPDGMV